MTIFRRFHNGTFPKKFCLQKSIIKLKAQDKKCVSLCYLKYFQQLDTPLLQVSTIWLGANSPPKNFDNDLNFTNFVHDFYIFAHFVMKN